MDCSLPGSSVHGISRQEHWSGLPSPPPGDLPNPGFEHASLMSPALAGGFFTTSTSLTWETPVAYLNTIIFLVLESYECINYFKN